MVLVVVLIVVAMLSLAGFAFSEMMLAEHQATAVGGQQRQALAAAESGVEFVARWAELPPTERDALGGWFDNPDRLRGVVVFADETGRGGQFTVLSPADDSEAGPQYGVVDESMRLHLAMVLSWEQQQPGAGRAALEQLPGMTVEVADSLLDWLDADNHPRESGAEADYYTSLAAPYTPRNGLPAALEELLLVRGVSRDLLFGLDLDRNGRVDGYEAALVSAASDGQPLAALEGMPAAGWSHFLTLVSAERNTTPEGAPRIDLNSDNLASLYVLLSRAVGESAARYIIAYRQFGPYAGSQPATSEAIGPLDLSRPARFRCDSVLDLVGTRVEVSFSSGRDAQVLASPFAADPQQMSEYLPQLLDHVTTDAAARLVGRINVNAAPSEVLRAVPGLESSVVEEILSKRGRPGEPPDPSRRHATWLLAEGLVDLPTMRRLLPYLTGRGDVVRAQVVGQLLPQGIAARVEVVIDATVVPARQLSWKDLQSLGRGYPATILGEAWSTEMATARPTPR